ncbi:MULTISPECIES: shikimate kinase [Helicobacter]|uniref:shikimate kinase n=1 Tax=Helicobacter TaxID=209 RepID=UPI002613E6D4|nr:shikimate kinase [Helicobacter sp. UBA3407]
MNSTNCVLIGFMGSGKSTIAKALHQINHALVLDSDSIIESNEGLSIKEIFSLYGEKYFRDLECKFCQFIAHNVQNAIISTGGGMPLFCDVQSMGKVFFLHLEFEKILSRFNAEERNQRPLFQNDDSALELYNMRLKHYQSCAHYVINADQSIQAITQEILEKL